MIVHSIFCSLLRKQFKVDETHDVMEAIISMELKALNLRLINRICLKSDNRFLIESKIVHIHAIF